MRLTLERSDLDPRFRDRPCSLIRLEHLTSQAQEAVVAAGGGVFKESDGSNYNAIPCDRR